MQGDSVYVCFLHWSGFDFLVKWPMGMVDWKDLRPIMFRELLFLSQMQWQRHAGVVVGVQKGRGVIDFFDRQHNHQ